MHTSNTVKAILLLTLAALTGCRASEQVSGELTALPDLQSPQIALVSPAAGASFTIGPAVSFEATATDNVQVTHVEFYLKTTLLCQATAAPFKCNASLPVGEPAGNITISAVAYDTNSLSAAVTRTIQILCPSLGYAVQSPNFVVSWTDSGEGCVLQSSSSVAGTYANITAGSIISTGTSRLYVTSLAAPSMFYRLIKPAPAVPPPSFSGSESLGHP